jgi:hypothetical protein
MRYGPMMAAALAMLGGTAHAERDLCSDRPGEATQACTLDPGRLQIETSLADYAHSRDAGQVEDQTLIGDTILRYGLGDTTELRFGWTAYGFDRVRDRGDGTVDHRHGTGDISVGFKQNIVHPDGKGFAFALLPFVTIPVGHTPIGAETWSAGMQAPATYELDEQWSLALTPEIDAAADEDEHHRHLAYSGAFDVNRKFGKDLTLTAEGYVQRDREPSGHETVASADFLAAYQIGDNSQVDLSAYKGLNHATPRVELIVGVTHRF